MPHPASSRASTAARPASRPPALALSALVLAAALTLGACSEKSAPPARGPVEVGTVTLKTQDVALPTELAGRTSAALASEVRPQVSGLIQARRFEEGARVQVGQVLYEIDAAPYRAALDQAKAALLNAQATVHSTKLKDQRYAALAADEGVARQDADDAHAAWLQAVAAVEQQKAALETARINLGYTQVRAPITGRIGTSSVTPGALVTASQSTALATIRALDPIHVDLTQSSADLLQLRRAMAAGGLQSGSAEVSLTLEDGSRYPLKGRLKFAEVAVDEATGSVTLRAQFPNPESVLLPGMYVRATLDQAVARAAILAPQQGITRDPKGKATALVVGTDGKVAQRDVTTTRALGDQWLIASGLAAGDRLIVQGTSKVRAGDAVKVVDVSPTTVAAGTAASAASAARTAASEARAAAAATPASER
ncbi:efflux RND transporter periplasmic adaptor subunit [Pseudaquabacterium rugosum]|uniref:Efflux RND transporter periplasmic adaptor subunit n=1 Tax=Pseudaquabacterium rugosum TaxID=2984194 RepID=A0ABU9BFR4_9BURK